MYLSSGLPNSNGEQLICQISINQPDTDRAQVIEIWQISIEEQIKDEKINYPEVYEKQCILMKSIISLSSYVLEHFIVFKSGKYIPSDIIQKLKKEHYQHIKLLGISTMKIFI